MWKRFLRAGGWLALLPLFVVTVALDSARQAHANAKRLTAEGVEASATITGRHEERRFVLGAGSRVAESAHVVDFTYAIGSVMKGDFHVGRGSVEVSREFYAAVQPGGNVPARCLPGDGTVCELEPGSLEAKAWNDLGVAAIIAGLSLPLFGWLAYRAARGGGSAA